MVGMKSLLSTGDLQRELAISRSKLERILRDWGRELPLPEVVAGCRLWPTESLESFRAILKRDRESRP